MKTEFMLMARYDAMPIIPAQRVVEDYFSHLTLQKFLRKVSEGDIPLPLVRMEGSQKSAKGVHVEDLAAYLDERREEAKREFDKMYG